MATIRPGYHPITLRERGYALGIVAVVYVALLLLILFHPPHAVAGVERDKVFRLFDVPPPRIPPPEPPHPRHLPPPTHFALRDPGGNSPPAHRRALPAAAPMVMPDTTFAARAPAIAMASDGAFGLAQAVAPPSPTGIDLSGAGDGTGGTGHGHGRGTGDGDGEGSGSGTMLYQASWVWKPTPRDLRPFYPDVARGTGLQGRAALACQVRLSTKVEHCRILKEEPDGQGFGTAGITASRIFRVHPPRRNGAPIDQAWVFIIINYVN